MPKKIIYLISALLLFLTLAAIALPFVISSDAVRAHLLMRAEQITGREMTFTGTPKVLLNPFLGVEISNVVFKSDFSEADEKPILSMERLRAKLSVASALTGNVELNEFQFIRPEFNLNVYSTGQSSWQFSEGKMWKVLQDARRLRDSTETGQEVDISLLPSIPFGNFKILDGVVSYENEITGIAETISNLNGDVNWKSTSSPFNFTGDGIWRGDAMKIQAQANSLIMMLAGGSTPMEFDLQSEPIALSFSGLVNRFSDVFMDGKLEVNSPSLRRFANLFDAKLPAGATLGQFTAAGDFSGTIEQFELGKTQLSLDGNEATGNLNFSVTENAVSRLTGTLAFTQFDMSPYFQLLQSATDQELPAQGELASLDNLEMDLRISSPIVNAPNFEIANFAGGVKSKDGIFSINIGNADIADGILVGDLSIASSEENFNIKTDINISGFNFENMAYFSNFGTIKPTGLGEIDLKLESEGADVSGLIRNLTGETKVSLKEGEIQGLDLGKFKQVIENQNEDSTQVQVNNISEGDTTPFDTLELTALVNHGVSWVTKSLISSEELQSTIVGKIDLFSGTLALRGNFLSENPDDQKPPLKLGSFFIGGTVAKPLYVVE